MKKTQKQAIIIRVDLNEECFSVFFGIFPKEIHKIDGKILKKKTRKQSSLRSRPYNKACM